MTKLERIIKDFEALAQYNATPEKGITRFCFTEEHKQAREYILGQLKEAGLEVREDAVGNIIGRREGRNTEAPSIMIGSHFDTVQNGGNFDGIAGVVAGMEIARVLNDKGLETDYPVEIIAINDEEGGRFKTGLFGSRAMVGKVDSDQLKALDEEGNSLGRAMEEFGLDPGKIEDALVKPGSIKAFLEMHIEQGPILETEKKDVGIVEGIVGLALYKVEVYGRPDHSGTTPMTLRKDALALAGKVIGNIAGYAIEAGDGTVGTVGKLEVLPGAVNIVPEKVTFTIDIRSGKNECVNHVKERVEEELKELCREMGLSYKMERLFSQVPIELSGGIGNVMRKSANNLGISNMDIMSGAGHDSMFMAEIAETAMLFVPSKNGRSHSQEEWTDYEQVQKGTEILLRTTIELAQGKL